MPTNYQLISAAIDDGRAISLVYDDDNGDDPRILLPYVLGESEVPGSDPVDLEKRALCYQYAGEGYIDPIHPSIRNWRCLKLELIVGAVSIVVFDGSFTPFPMNGRDRARQNCVQNIDNFRRPH